MPPAPVAAARPAAAAAGSGAGPASAAHVPGGWWAPGTCSPGTRRPWRVLRGRAGAEQWRQWASVGCKLAAWRYCTQQQFSNQLPAYQIHLPAAPTLDPAAPPIRYHPRHQPTPAFHLPNAPVLRSPLFTPNAHQAPRTPRHVPRAANPPSLVAASSPASAARRQCAVTMSYAAGFLSAHHAPSRGSVGSIGSTTRPGRQGAWQADSRARVSGAAGRPAIMTCGCADRGLIAGRSTAGRLLWAKFAAASTGRRSSKLHVA